VRESLVDHPVEGLDCLLERRVLVGSVSEDNVYLVHLQSSQAVADALDDVLAGEPDVVGALTDPLELSGDHDVFPLEVAFLECLVQDRAHDGLCHSEALDFGSVEVVDAEVQSFTDALGLRFHCFVLVSCDPVSERQSSNFQS